MPTYSPEPFYIKVIEPSKTSEVFLEPLHSANLPKDFRRLGIIK